MKTKLITSVIILAALTGCADNSSRRGSSAATDTLPLVIPPDDLNVRYSHLETLGNRPIDDVAIIIDSTRRVADTIFLHMRYVNASPHGDLYGQPYRLERLDNGEWVDVHTDDIFTLEGHMFPPHSTSTVVRRIVNLPLPAGTYRVSVNFDYDAPSSPFRTRIDRPTSAVFYLP